VELARPARQADHAACRELLAGLLTAARSMRGGPALIGQRTPGEILARWTDARSAVLLVGEYHGAVVGLGGAAMTAAEGPNGPVARIECCFVQAEARGVGVGTALMDALVEWCGQMGCGDIDALALPGDRAMKQRLEAAGFTARLLTLSRRTS
jgi:GNAT superfamily N-acetyltransferase